MNSPSTLKIVRTDDGFVIRVNGSGTLRVSPALDRFVTESLRSDQSVVIDLSACCYLDSTCLGCLVKLSMIARERNHPLRVFAAPDERQNLFGNSRLDQMLEFTNTLPDPVSSDVDLNADSLEPTDLAEHIMRCHRILGGLDTPEAINFRSVADRIEAELNAKSD